MDKTKLRPCSTEPAVTYMTHVCIWLLDSVCEDTRAGIISSVNSAVQHMASGQLLLGCSMEREVLSRQSLRRASKFSTCKQTHVKRVPKRLSFSTRCLLPVLILLILYLWSHTVTGPPWTFDIVLPNEQGMHWWEVVTWLQYDSFNLAVIDFGSRAHLLSKHMWAGSVEEESRPLSQNKRAVPSFAFM